MSLVPTAAPLFPSSPHPRPATFPFADWKSTVFIVTYDESGGFFEHIPPPRVAAPNKVDPDLAVCSPVLLPGELTLQDLMVLAPLGAVPVPATQPKQK